jgi:hypothetical protein
LSFKDIAQPLIRRGVPVIPLLPRTKKAFFDDWPTLATTDPAQILRWDAQYPDANIGSVGLAKPDGIWFFEIDDPNLCHRIENEEREKFPKTFRVRSSPGKGHIYFKHTSASLELAAKKAYYSLPKPDGTGEFCSARLNHAYVAGPGSIHPKTLLQYQILSDNPIADAPEWLIDWIKKNLVDTEKLPVTASLDGPKIPRGSHDNELTRIAGKLRGAGMEVDSIADALIEICEKRCEDYGSDYKEMCEKIAHSIGRKPAGDGSIPLIYHGPTVAQGQAQQAASSEPLPEPEVDDTDLVVRPIFPDWVMPGTSLYENLVKPAIQSSDKYPELIFMPAVQMYLNTLALRVQSRAQRGHVPNLFLGVIAPYGHFFKSSSCELAQEFFKIMGFAADYEGRSKAGDRVILVSAGSPEGLGLRMRDCDGKHSLLYFDELGTCVSKAGIDHSSYVEQLCTMYEARKFENEIKARKDSFSFPAGQYCFSWCWCTTDRKFPGLWMSLANEDSGLNDRMFFLLAPEEERETHMYDAPNLLESAPLTRKLIDKAIEKKEFDYEDREDAQQKIRGVDPRSQALFQDLALYFAIDQGLDSIDADCCERARALVEYRNQTQAFLDPVQADTRQGKIQIEIIRMLKLHQGKMPLRDLKKEMHSERLGTRMWNDAMKGLLEEGTLVYRDAVSGKGLKPEDQKPAMIYLPKQS